MKIEQLSGIEANASGANKRITLTHEDLTQATANTAQAVALFSVKKGTLVEIVATYVSTAFKDASDTAFNTTTLIIGDSVDDDRLLASQELNVNGTEILAKAGTGPYVYAADGTVNATFGSMAEKSLVNIDTGALVILARVVETQTLLG